MKWRLPVPFITRNACKRIAVLFAVLGLLGLAGGWVLLSMPGESYDGPMPETLMPDEELSRANLKRHVETLAGQIGQRNVYTRGTMERSACYISDALTSCGYSLNRFERLVEETTCTTIEARLDGSNPDAGDVVIGAHYDTPLGVPGADDNASGVAVLLELARLLAGTKPVQTVRFVAFANEEAPFYGTDDMGSWLYAKSLKRDGVRVTAMLSLETVGYYSTEPNSQQYPVPGMGRLYPLTGDYIAFTGNTGSRGLVRQVVRAFRRAARLPSEGAALPESVPGVAWSDHVGFWEQGYSALMVTNTAFYRNARYHTAADTPDTLDYPRMALLVSGLRAVVADLAAITPR